MAEWDVVSTKPVAQPDEWTVAGEVKVAPEAAGRVDKALESAKRFGGEAAAIADLVLGMPNFLVRTGAQLGGGVMGGLFGEDPLRAARQTGESYDKALSKVPVLRTAGNPLRHLMDSFRSGEAYDQALTTQGMEKLTHAIEAAGVWTEQATGGRVSRDAVPLFVETLMTGATGLGPKAKPGAIPGHVTKALREHRQKMVDQAELDARAESISPAEEVMRRPVQQEINAMLGIRTPAEQAKITRQRRKDIQAAFREPAEGSDFQTGIDESIFRAEERLDREQRYNAERAREGNAGRQQGLLDNAPNARIETEPLVGQAEALEILRKPGFERTAEDLVKLRRLERGEARPEALALAASVGIGGVAGALMSDDELRGATLGMATGAAFALPHMFKGESLGSARWRERGAMGLDTRSVTDALMTDFAGPDRAKWTPQAKKNAADYALIKAKQTQNATQKALYEQAAKVLRGEMEEPGLINIAPGRGPGRGQLGAVKAPGGMWHPEAVERLAAPLSLGMARDVVAEIGRGALRGEQAGAAVTSITNWAKKAIKRYLDRYAGTEKDPLKDVEIPFKDGTARWEEISDITIHGRPAREVKGSAKAAEQLKDVPDADTIWETGNWLSISEGKAASPKAAESALKNYLSHVGDYLRQNVDPAKLPQYDLVRAVRETYQNDLRVAKEMEKAAAASTKDLPVYKDYGDGFKWVELKLPEKLTEEQSKQVRPESYETWRSRVSDPGRGRDAKEAYVEGRDLKASYEQAKKEGRLAYEAVGADGKPVKNAYTGELAVGPTPERAYLAGRLAEEGNQMGHCVGGYCEGVASGESRIFSLRDAKGQSHVTIETTPTRKLIDKEFQEPGVEYPENIEQIKGKQNRAPDAKYLPYVQDFVKSGPLDNTEIGYRGTPKDAQGSQGRFGNTEGNGLYVAASQELAKFFGEPREIRYQKPKKALKVNEEPLPLLQEDYPIFDSVKSTDSEWIKLNKEALRRAQEKYGVTEQKWEPELVGDELTLLLKEKGYDAVDITSGGESWKVLLDENLYKPRQWGEVGDLGNTGLQDLQYTGINSAEFRALAEELFPGQRFLDEAQSAKLQEEGVTRSIADARNKMYGPERGAIDQKLVVGLGALGLGGLIGSQFSEDPVNGGVLGLLATGAVGLAVSKGAVKAAVDALEYAGGMLSTRIKNESAALHQRLITNEMRTLEQTHAALNKAVPWMRESVNLPSSKRAALDAAIFMKDAEGIAAVNRGNPALVSGWREVRNTLTDLGKKAQELGRFQSLLDDYFPQRVKDYKGLLEAMGKPFESRIKVLLDQAEKKAVRRGSTLSDVERDAIVNREIRRQYETMSSRPGYSRKRTIEQVTENLRNFYHTPQEALAITLSEVVKDLETARMFGKDLVQKKQEGRTYIDYEASIGNIVGREIKEGKIRPEAQAEVIELLRSRFGPGEKAAARSIQNLQNLGYAALLADLPSAAVQLGDPALAIPAHGVRATIVAMMRKLSGNATVTAKDLALMDHIAEDLAFGSTQTGSSLKKTRAAVAGGAIAGATAGALLQDDAMGAIPGAAAGAFVTYASVVGTAAALNRVLRQGVFSPIDRFGKDIQLGAAHDKLMRWAQTKDGLKNLENAYGEAFGQDFPNLVRDLKSQKLTERVRSVLFAELSRTQPISRLESPQALLDLGGKPGLAQTARLPYMLKRFMLKQIDFMRREAFSKIAEGYKEGGEKGLAKVGKGAGNLLEFTTVLGMSGATAAMIQDFLLGREVNFEATDVAENALKTFGLTRYLMDKVSKGDWGPVQAVASVAMPPWMVMERILTTDPKAVQYIPVIGQLYYNWELGGKEEAEIRRAREQKAKGKDVQLSPAAERYLERKREERRAKREKEDR